MNNYEVKCNNCDFVGMEEELIKVVEFKEKCDSETQYLALNDFKSKYRNLNEVYESDIINGCPDCLQDGYLMNIECSEPELLLDYKGAEVYHLYKDFDTKDSVWEYYYTLDLNDTEGFDIRELSTYNENLSIEDNLKLAIDNNLL